MFAEACQKATGFTRPVIISTKTFAGEVTAGCGAFIVLNNEGWILTAGHLFDSFMQFQQDSKKVAEIKEANDVISSPPIKMDPDWISNHSFWWGKDNVRITNIYVNRQIDICIGKLEPFDPSWVSEYPVFKNPDKIHPGTSLCRLGFPFLNIESDFDEQFNAFRIKPGVLPLTLFPNDGMYTRNVYKGKSMDGDFDMLYLETSTPGLKGQSGGPIYDKDCKIAAMQVQTAHLPLGFHPKVEYKGKMVTENQFLNVGLGVHVKTIIELLNYKGVKFNLEE